jgi:hypothetical protein
VKLAPAVEHVSGNDGREGEKVQAVKKKFRTRPTQP